MSRNTGRVALVCLFPLLLISATGCSSMPGQGFPFGSPPHKLTDAAKELKAAYPDLLALPRELDKTFLAAYVVEPGDALLVQPADLDSPVRLPGDQPVLPDGTIDLGRYGRLIVAGKTMPVIEADVKAQVQTQAKDAGPITVRLVSRVSKVYYVLGDVNAPGSFPLAGRETVLDGILAAGGINSKADQKNIILSRPTTPTGCRIVLPICYRNIVQLGDTSTNYQLMPGDRIYVPSPTCMDSLMFWKKDECPPCDKAQVPCAIGLGGVCAPAAGLNGTSVPVSGYVQREGEGVKQAVHDGR
jgi:polysaccharide export outer membrane protein